MQASVAESPCQNLLVKEIGLFFKPFTFYPSYQPWSIWIKSASWGLEFVPVTSLKRILYLFFHHFIQNSQVLLGQGLLTFGMHIRSGLNEGTTLGTFLPSDKHSFPSSIYPSYFQEHCTPTQTISQCLFLFQLSVQFVRCSLRYKMNKKKRQPLPKPFAFKRRHWETEKPEGQERGVALRPEQLGSLLRTQSPTLTAQTISRWLQINSLGLNSTFKTIFFYSQFQPKKKSQLYFTNVKILPISFLRQPIFHFEQFSFLSRFVFTVI